MFDQSICHQLLLASELPDFSELLRFQIEFFEGLNHYSPFDFGLSVSQNQKFVVGDDIFGGRESIGRVIIPCIERVKLPCVEHGHALFI